MVQSHTDNILKQMELNGYYAPRRLQLTVASLLNHKEGNGAAAVLLEGLPGSGKTTLGETLAKAGEWPLVYSLLHAWTDTDELYVGVDVAAAVGGDAANVRQKGVLAQAARLTGEHEKVVLILDEIDKTHERCEALLLDFLQTGRVPVSPNKHVQADLSRLMVLITSNGQRDLSDAFLRRVRRVWVDPLPCQLMNNIVHDKTGVPSGIVKMISKACRSAAREDGTVLSLQELVHAVHECWELAENHNDIVEILCAWGARGNKGRGWVLNEKPSTSIWAEIVKARNNF